jgi:GT2 family glycosyltransferase
LQQLARPELDRIEQYGVPPAAPLTSLVIPLYRRIDFLEHQLAQFVRDPELCRADLVYVLDSPELADALHGQALQLGRLYRVPFRIVYLKTNVGFAGATNAGVEQARGRFLVLFNSDVLPDRPGWLGQMAAFALKMPRLGALGPKLVYEDETLQHAGMYFLRQPGAAVWENAHYYKGLHRNFPAAQETRIVPAVTGACLMIRDDRYQEVGGLHNLFIQGDYEDSDLCLRLSQKGYDNWYLADCELYHLEGQSYPGPLRSLVYQVNSWQHTELWGKYIEEIMSRMMPRAA